MLVKTGLLIVSNPKHIGRILSSVQKQVKNTLYIQLLTALTDPFGCFHASTLNSWPKYSQTIYGIYSHVATHCQNLDVRVILSGLKYSNVSSLRTQQQIEVVIFDKVHKQNDIDAFLGRRISNIVSNCPVITADTGQPEELVAGPVKNDSVYKHAVLGGTFDRLHLAHKLLLSEAALRSTDRITVGVTEENMLASKTLWELIRPIETRVEGVRSFLTDICPELNISVVPIADAFGPTQHDPTMQMIVVSEETIKGGLLVNQVRAANNLAPLDVVTVELIDQPFRNPYEEQKISSSTSRMRVLGTLLKPVEENALIPKKPYVIGLTGGIASGKSSISEMLGELGADVINCDKVGHTIYQKGKPCHAKLVGAFGERILDIDGEVNRKQLGAIVFSSPAELDKLNSLVWPAMLEEVNNAVASSSSKVVVVEAAILLKAGWGRYCHEVWTTMIPPEEAVLRLKQRNNLDEQQARARIAAQPTNQEAVRASNVVLCTLWPREYTRQLVNRAWALLQERLPS